MTTDSARPRRGRRSPPGTAEAAAGAAGGDSTADSLITHERDEGYRSRRAAAQRDLLDEPRTAVTDADTLVGAAFAQLAATFRAQRPALERQWPDNESSTEDLRITGRRNRTFLNRRPSLGHASRLFTLLQSTG